RNRQRGVVPARDRVIVAVYDDAARGSRVDPAKIDRDDVVGAGDVDGGLWPADRDGVVVAGQIDDRAAFSGLGVARARNRPGRGLRDFERHVAQGNRQVFVVLAIGLAAIRIEIDLLDQDAVVLVDVLDRRAGCRPVHQIGLPAGLVGNLGEAELFGAQQGQLPAGGEGAVGILLQHLVDGGSVGKIGLVILGDLQVGG